ncbi:hypothetical protein ACEXQD_18180 [Herbiconiux sp. P15]|uniref:Vgb family protein n=1 Tax=Herbiconiux liukaitaii TaxID=3342799 RepID=UPI0035BAF2B1
MTTTTSSSRIAAALVLSLVTPPAALGPVVSVAALDLPPAGISLWHDVPLANPSGIAEVVTSDARGDIWYYDSRDEDLVRVDSATRSQQTFALGPRAWVLGIVGVSDGTIWYTDLRDHTINHLDPATGSIDSFPLTGVSYTPSSLALGSDGNVWFGDPFATNLVQVSPAGVLTMVAEPRDERILAVATAPDGRLLYTRTGSDRVGALDLSTGTFSDLGVGGSAGGALTVGASGAVWIDGVGEFTRIAPDGTVTTHPMSVPGPIAVRPIALAGGDLAGDDDVELSFIDPEHGFGTIDASGAPHFSRLDGARTSLAVDGKGHLWVNDLWGASLQWR